MKELKQIFDYRQMISGLVRMDLRGRYKGSVLGFLWTFVNPLLQLVVYTLVFSVVMKNGIEKYYMYLFVGLVPWMFFSTSVTGGSSSVLSQKEMVKKIYFPRAVLPISVVTSGFVNMLLTFIVIFLVILVTRFGVNFIALLCLPIIMFVEYILSLGFAMITAGITVYFRDLEYILGIITMAWMYVTPIFYGLDMVPEKLRVLISLNPMSPIIIAYRDILYYKQIPELTTLIQSFIVGIIFLVLGYFVFQKLQKGFAEEL